MLRKKLEEEHNAMEAANVQSILGSVAAVPAVIGAMQVRPRWPLALYFRDRHPQNRYNNSTLFYVLEHGWPSIAGPTLPERSSCCPYTNSVPGLSVTSYVRLGVQ